MDISLRSTRIQTFDNKLVIIPNSIMANGVITNVSKPDRSRRVVIKFGAEYGSDPDYVKKIVLDEITKIKLVEKKDPAPRVVFKDMGESALLFEALYWVKDLDNFVDAKEEGTTRIYERLSKENIGIPFPSRTIYLNDVSKGKTKPYEKKA
jgi:small-conductance mechanosensitive channel